ncbi:hypothetical protein QR680_016998 [Steinernema hermaphroditum]|uniref:Uncharacterized protein n=1 Tax=Steinernema hermaphroditum TaxID=289476 RepID=A0AA39HCY7_9BILA|nr:hypothetical protein QR680_016998 [Steinernema hermaphroditum]
MEVHEVRARCDSKRLEDLSHVVSIGTTKGCEFVKRQIELGNVKELNLWPECQTELQNSLHSFVASPHFEQLSIIGSDLNLDFEVVACFVDRFFKGDLGKGASLRGKPSFPLAQIIQLYTDDSVEG